MRVENALKLENLLKRNKNILFSGFYEEDQNFTPIHIWKHIAGIEARPSIIFSEQCIDDASKYWWKLAQFYGFISKSKVSCFISIGTLGDLPWALVDFPINTAVFKSFAINEDYPEFIIMNKSQNTFLAVTTEENEIWIYLVKRDNFKLNTLAIPFTI